MSAAALQGAGQGAATGTAVNPGWGTAIGAAAGFGMGLLGKKRPMQAPGGPNAALQGVATQLQTGGQQLGAAGQRISGLGEQQVRGAAPGLDAASGYYGSLVRGNQGAMAAAVAPEVGAITDVYRGASRSLDRSGPMGANREVAEAELARQRAAAISGIVINQRPQAAAALGGLSMGRLQAGTGLMGTGGSLQAAGLQGIAQSGNPLGQIYGRDERDVNRADDQSTASGGAWANMIFDLISAYKGGGMGGKKPALPASYQTFRGVPYSGS